MTLLCTRCRGRVIQELDELVCLSCGRRLPVAVLEGWRPLRLPAGRHEPRRSGRNSARVSCPHGHPYDDKNTYRDPAGWRHCRTCGLQGDRRRREAASPARNERR